MIKVIIADDEEKVCQLICGLVDWPEKEMEIAGVAHNGIEALEAVERFHPDLMITDIRMPGYDGLELISRAKDVCPELECIIISGYRHFEYAQNAIKYGVEEYLLKPINKDELNKTLDKIRYKYQIRMKKLSEEEYLRMRLDSDIQALRLKLYTDLQENGLKEDTASVNERYHYRFDEGIFQIFIVKYDYGRRGEPESGTELLKAKIRQIVTGILQERCTELEVFPADGQVCCILNYRTGQGKDIHKGIRSVLDELLVQKGIFGNVLFTIGKGQAAAEISGLAASWESAQRCVEERIILGTDRVIEEVGEERQKEKIDRITAVMMKEMDSAVETLDVETAMHAISMMKQELSSIQGIHGSGILRAVQETGRIYLMALRKYGLRLPREEAFFDAYIQGVDQCSQSDDVLGFAASRIRKSMEGLIEERNQESSRPIRLAKQYIKENYKRPITLEEVSSFAGFNPTYFSSLFKKESGSNFLEYLSEIRMNRAKELLKETNMSVAVICEEVGYSDIKHFTKSFKKIAGINPKDYRKLYS